MHAGTRHEPTPSTHIRPQRRAGTPSASGPLPPSGRTPPGWKGTWPSPHARTAPSCQWCSPGPEAGGNGQGTLSSQHLRCRRDSGTIVTATQAYSPSSHSGRNTCCRHHTWREAPRLPCWLARMRVPSIVLAVTSDASMRASQPLDAVLPDVRSALGGPRATGDRPRTGGKSAGLECRNARHDGQCLR